MANERRCHPHGGNPNTGERREGFLARLNALETIVLAAILLIAFAGLMLIGKGLYMKATAERSGAPVQLGFNSDQQGYPGTAC